MNQFAYLLLLGTVSAVSDEPINFSYMKRKEAAKTDDYTILSTVSNWFSGEASSEDLDLKYKSKRSLQNLNPTYQIYDYSTGVLADYQYGTYYNYNYGDLYDTNSGGNYNYNTNLYYIAKTTNTQTVTYSVVYRPPSYSKIYIPPAYSKVTVAKGYTASTATITITTTNSTKPKEAKKADPDGTICKMGSDCKSYCCTKNLAVLPKEGVMDLYGLRPQYYNAQSKTYSPPGGKVYSYTDKVMGNYDTTYGCYGGSYYDFYAQKTVIAAYDTYNQICLGSIYKDFNYVNYNSQAYLTEAKAKNLTIPTDYYYTYIPQKSGNMWNYKDNICQNNYTMCTAGKVGGGGVVGAVIGCIFALICFVIVYKVVLKPMFRGQQTQEIEVMIQPGKEVEVMVDAGEHTVSQSVTNTTTTQAYQQFGPPPGVMMMPPPPNMMMQPGGMGMGMQHPGMMQPQMDPYQQQMQQQQMQPQQQMYQQ